MDNICKLKSTALVLQGGGALGAYQGGVYEALAAAGHEPDWIAGVSIGAINAAIIAGNPAALRVERLRAFWDLLSSRLTAPSLFPAGFMRTLFNEVSANIVMATGVPGFFEPRFPPAALSMHGTPGAISHYDTTPLRQTLLDLIDFDRINAREMRLSVGAVNVITGNLTYFDTNDCVICPEHIMASGALPPGFAPVMIDGVPYWDGGLVSNTPLQYVLDHRELDASIEIFQVDLFNARGAMPKSLSDVAQREKDIRYSSRTRLNTDMARELMMLREASYRLAQKLPDSFQDDPDAQLLGNRGCDSAVTIMHLINRSEAYDTHSKDYEFSRQSVNGHWDAGRCDVEHSVHHQSWIDRKPIGAGMQVFDLVGRS
jgi:NTE family protein